MAEYSGGGLQPHEHNFIGCQITSLGNQAVTSGVWTAILLPSEHFDTDSMHNPTSDTHLININTAGVYLITWNILTFAGTSWNIPSRIMRVPSGGAAENIIAHAKKSNAHYYTMTGTRELGVGDTIHAEWYQDSGISKSVRKVVSYSPMLSVVRLGGF